MEAVAVGLKIFQAIEARKQAKTEAKMIELQGQFDKIKTQQAALDKEEQALDVIDEQRRFNAAAFARAAAGGVDAFSGTALNITVQNATEAGQAYQTLIRQASTLEGSAGFQAGQALATAEQTRRAGNLQAVGYLGEAAYYGSQT